MITAVVLAGGSGRRAKPFTDYSPKPLIPLLGRPIIDYIIRHLCSFESVQTIAIVTNLSGQGEQIRTFFEGKERSLKKRIMFINDANRGTGGAILEAKADLKPNRPFLVWFGDNICPLDVDDMLRFHAEKRGLGCVAVRKVRKEESGFVKIDRSGLVKEFVEKPMLKLPMPESLGIYLFSYKILGKMERFAGSRFNLSVDILQSLDPDDRFYAYQVKDLSWLDVESPTKLERYLEVAKTIAEKLEGRWK